MDFYKKMSFKELKTILLEKKNLPIEHEIIIRTIMKNKLEAYKRKEKTIHSLIEELNMDEGNDLEDDRYNLEIKKDKLNSNLVDRMNSEYKLITERKQTKQLIESPYDNVEPISKVKLSNENIFKNIKCKKDVNNNAIHSYNFNNFRPKEPSPLDTVPTSYGKKFN